MSKIYARYNKLTLRLVEVADANFIIKLRNIKPDYLNKTVNNTKQQINWIQQYKLREKENNEFYFIAEDNGIRIGTTRIYKINESSFTSGSWVFLPDMNNKSIISSILSRKWAFEFLNKEINYFDVRKDNKKVLKYHSIYKPLLVFEDKYNFYYSISKELFNKKSKLILSMLNISMEDLIINI